ncbi:MAG: Uma2 family endonuclease [candidate division NC10 bacterium]|nr:Uma2 family endonuclease [candidate division NC10 bacterium]MDE2321240.1 Uma2 family endonuclease [candidate division NC10 bacterium]
MTVQLVRHRFTVEEFRRMAESRILTEDSRVELVEGELIEMTPIGSRHAACVDRLNRLFSQRVGETAIVRVQNPIDLGRHSELQPDLVLARPRPDFYAGAHPSPEAILLVVEVAETSAEFDREVKVPLYAQAGIPEVWLVTLAQRTIAIYRDPTGAGYQEVRSVGPGEVMSPLALPEIVLSTESVLEGTF